MVRQPPTRFAVLVVTGLLVALLAWSWLTFSSAAIRRMDLQLQAQPLDPNSGLAEIASGFALLTWPGLQYVALLGIAIWAYQRRLRQLSIALVLVTVLGWGGADLIKILVGRARPESGLDLLTYHGYSFPSGHVAGVVASTIAVGATFAVTRQTARVRTLWMAGAAVLVLAVALDRWILGAHYVSDLIAGALFGALVATASLVIAGVKVPVPYEIVNEAVTEIVRSRGTPEIPAAPVGRAAVIFNPAKVTDWITFRRHVEYELKSRGWERALWLETTPEDPGRAMTRQAVDEQVDLVLGAGGDGTIRIICAELAGTGIPFGLIPAGTGNLLARNIGIPLDEVAALDVAFDGVDKAVDLVRVTVDGRVDHFAVMAGIGVDAAIMQSTNADLKKTVGSAAYFVAAAQNAQHPPLQTTVRVDDLPPVRRKAHLILVGNVGYLQGNIPLMPDARADDGLLDVMIASPRSLRDWVRLTAGVMTRRRRGDEQLDRMTGRRVTITVDERDHYQLDGDTVGQCTAMVAEVVPGALTLRVPRTPESVRSAAQAVEPVDRGGVVSVGGAEAYVR